DKKGVGRIFLPTPESIDPLVLATAMLAKNQPLCCPNCQQPVMLKGGQRVAPYFAHVRPAGGTGESQTHRLGKTAIGALAVASDYQVDYEVPIGQHQRADVLATRDAQSVVIEYQCSPLTPTCLAQRTNDYLVAGLTVIWVLGERFWPKHRWFSQQQLAFIQYRPEWGFYLLGYAPHQQKWLLYHHIVTIDFKGYFWQNRYLTAQQALKLIAQPANISIGHQWSPIGIAQQRQVIQNRLIRMDAQLVSLQQACYQQGLTLQTVPRWCYCLDYVPPLFETGQFMSRVHWLLERQSIDFFGDYATRLQQPLLPTDILKDWPIRQLVKDQQILIK
ncbi:competence protein CoiA, partial [Latilactobacillus fuchuensis]